MVNAPPRPADIKVVFTGPMGAGKTTAIRNISDVETLSTEVPLGAESVGDKVSTTVGLDYGECRLDDANVLKLFGTPGQDRFRFMWDILGQGAFGLIVLLDNSRPDPIGDAEHYLDAFAPHVPARRTVIGVGRMDRQSGPSIDDYCARLRNRDCHAPVIDVDERRADDVRLLLSILVSLAEADEL